MKEHRFFDVTGGYICEVLDSVDVADKNRVFPLLITRLSMPLHLLLDCRCPQSDARSQSGRTVREPNL